MREVRSVHLGTSSRFTFMYVYAVSFTFSSSWVVHPRGKSQAAPIRTAPWVQLDAPVASPLKPPRLKPSPFLASSPKRRPLVPSPGLLGAMKNQIGNPNLIRPPPRSTKCFTQFARRSGERCWELSNTTTRAQRPHFCTLLALRHSQEIWSDPVKRPRNGQGTKKVASSSQKSSFPGVPQPLPLSSERDVQSGHVCQALPNSYRRRATRGQWNALEQRQEPRW